MTVFFIFLIVLAVLGLVPVVWCCVAERDGSVRDEHSMIRRILAPIASCIYFEYETQSPLGPSKSRRFDNKLVAEDTPLINNFSIE